MEMCLDPVAKQGVARYSSQSSDQASDFGGGHVLTGKGLATRIRMGTSLAAECPVKTEKVCQLPLSHPRCVDKFPKILDCIGIFWIMEVWGCGGTRPERLRHAR